MKTLDTNRRCILWISNRPGVRLDNAQTIMAYTKKRTEEIFAVAVAIVSEFGIENLDSFVSLVARKAQLVAMAHQHAAATGVTFETSRQYIARACRRMRSPDWQPPQRGGARNGAGRPRKDA